MDEKKAKEKLLKLYNKLKIIKIGICLVPVILIVTIASTMHFNFSAYRNVQIDYQKFDSTLSVDDFCYVDIMSAIPYMESSQVITRNGVNTGTELPYSGGTYYCSYTSDDEICFLYVENDRDGNVVERFNRKLNSEEAPIRFYGRVCEAPEDFELDLSMEMLSFSIDSGEPFLDSITKMKQDIQSQFNEFRIIDVDLNEAKEYSVKAGMGPGFYFFCLYLVLIAFEIMLVKYKKKLLYDARRILQVEMEEAYIEREE